MKRILVTCVMAMVCNAITVTAQSLKRSDLNYLDFYFSLTPQQRVSFAQIEVPTGDISNFWLVSYDLASMTTFNLIQNEALNLSGVVNGIFVANDTAFSQLIDSMRMQVSDKSYLKSKHVKILDKSDSTARSILKVYVQNSPLERIEFIEKYFERISAELISMMQKDLDVIFATKTVQINQKRSNFYEAKNKWLAQAEKLK